MPNFQGILVNFYRVTLCLFKTFELDSGFSVLTHGTPLTDNYVLCLIAVYPCLEPNFDTMEEDNVIANMTCFCIVGIEVKQSLGRVFLKNSIVLCQVYPLPFDPQF